MKYRKEKDSKPIPVLLDVTLRERIAAVSERMGEPKSTVMRIAMRLGLEGLETAFEAGQITADTLRAAAYPEHKPNIALAADSGEVDIEKIADEIVEEVAQEVMGEGAASAGSAKKAGSTAPVPPGAPRSAARSGGPSGAGVSYRTPSKRKNKSSGGK